MTLRFDGRVAIVTGAGRGLGRGYAQFLADRGASVVVNDIFEDSAQQTVEEIVKAGGGAVAAPDSVAERDGAERIAETALRNYGHVDIFIHNAGAAKGPLEDHLDVNVWGGVWIAQRLWQQMIDRRYGRILFTTSGIGIFGNATNEGFGEDALYGVAKMGEVGLMRHLAVRGAGRNVNVNAISPLASTNSLANATDLYSATPGIRWVRDHCTVENVVPVAAWLVHEDCTANAEIYRAAGGHVGRIFIAETQGYLGRPLTIEDVRDHFSEVNAEDGYVVPRHADDSPAYPKDI